MSDNKMDDRAHILKILSKLDHEEKSSIGTPYKIPENYFETFNDRIINIVDNEFQNTEGSLLLEQLSKEPVFQVPEGYFQHFEKSIRCKITAAPTSRISYFKNWYKIAAAAAVVILVALGTLKYSGTNIPSSDPRISAITIEDISSLELDAFAEEIPKSPGNDYDKKNFIDNNQLFIGVSSQELHNFLNENMASGNDFF
ncbi:MAG: hypothetical protein QM594_16225 [Niabella sp.]